MANETRARACSLDEPAGPEHRAIDTGCTEEKARESELIKRCLDGDPEAFSPLVTRYSPSLHSFVVRYVGSKDDACDIVQEAFLRSYRALSDYDPSFRFSTWLYRIALNLCRDHLKRTAPGRLAVAVENGSEDCVTRDPIEERIDDRRLCELALALARELPAMYREPLLLKDVESMDYRTMARVTGLTVGLLKIRVMRARRRLAGDMQKMGYVPSTIAGIEDDET